MMHIWIHQISLLSWGLKQAHSSSVQNCPKNTYSFSLHVYQNDYVKSIMHVSYTSKHDTLGILTLGKMNHQAQWCKSVYQEPAADKILMQSPC